MQYNKAASQSNSQLQHSFVVDKPTNTAADISNMEEFVTKTANAEEDVYHWHLERADRDYTLSETTFTKRQLREDEKEMKVNTKGERIIIPYSRERLENERDVLEFISKNTTIPVPKNPKLSIHEGLASLSMDAVGGTLMCEILEELDEEDGTALVNTVNTYINDTVLPQLRRLTSRKVGTLGGIVIPPWRVQNRDPRPYWRSRTSLRRQYVFCHNDLAQHNILIDPETLKVSYIIDWEFAGFYPAEFEFPFWLNDVTKSREYSVEEWEKFCLIDMLDEPGKQYEYILSNNILDNNWNKDDEAVTLLFSWLSKTSFAALSILFAPFRRKRPPQGW